MKRASGIPLYLSVCALLALAACSGPEGPHGLSPAAPTSVNPVASSGGESRTASAPLDDIDVEVIGLVEDITGSETCPARSFSIRDRRVTTSVSTRYEDVTCETLAERQVVKVEGNSLPDGSILARKVERRDEARPAGQVELRGSISNLDPASACPARTFDIGTDHVVPSGGTRYEGLTCETLQNEQNVKVEGTRRASDGAVLAHKIELRDKFAAEGTARNLTGSCPALAFDLLHSGGTTSIRTDSATQFEVDDRDATCQAFREAVMSDPGAEVEVKSRRPIRDAAGRVTGWTADEAEVEDARPPGGEVEVRGPISNLGPASTCPNRLFDVGADHIVTSERTRYDDVSCETLANAMNVKVEGTRGPGGSILARKVERRRDGPGPGGEVEVRGTISGLSPAGDCPARTFSAGGERIRASSDTRYDDTSCKALENGMEVEVKGTIQSDRTILASRIKKKD